MPQPTALLTADGSHTLATPDGILYHSHHGAIQESRHIFIGAGLKEAASVFPEEDLRVLEIGFGTGLNTLLTALEGERLQRSVRYTTTELQPISADLAAALNYPRLLSQGDAPFRAIHAASWETPVAVAPFFTLIKHRLDVATQPLPAGAFHCIFFDAFAPEDQPELWTKSVFQHLYERTEARGILITYCSKGVVRRAMQAAGWTVEKLPGPPGKREIVRARKLLM